MTIVSTSGQDSSRTKASARVTETPGAIMAESFTRDMSTVNSVAPIAGIAHLRRISLVPGAYTTLTYAIGSQKAITLTNTFFGIYSIDGLTQFGVSADQSTPLAAVNTFSIGTATVNSTITVAADYWVAFLVGTASTLPFFTGATHPSITQTSLTPALIQKHSAGSLSALPATVTLAAPTAAYNPWFRYE